MFAGRMKLKTFVGIAAVLGLAGVGGAYALYDSGPDETYDEPTKVAQLPDSDTQPAGPNPQRPRPNFRSPPSPHTPSPSMGDSTPTPSPQPAAVDGPSGSAAERAMMKWVGRDLGSKKRKDVTSGQPFKINVYQDAGESTANRAKVDLDRDDKWDEKWTFKPGEISRKVSTADDDNYDKKQVWKNGAWSAR